MIPAAPTANADNQPAPVDAETQARHDLDAGDIHKAIRTPEGEIRTGQELAPEEKISPPAKEALS